MAAADLLDVGFLLRRMPMQAGFRVGMRGSDSAAAIPTQAVSQVRVPEARRLAKKNWKSHEHSLEFDAPDLIAGGDSDIGHAEAPQFHRGHLFDRDRPDWPVGCRSASLDLGSEAPIPMFFGQIIWHEAGGSILTIVSTRKAELSIDSLSSHRSRTALLIHGHFSEREHEEDHRFGARRRGNRFRRSATQCGRVDRHQSARRLRADQHRRPSQASSCAAATRDHCAAAIRRGSATDLPLRAAWTSTKLASLLRPIRRVWPTRVLRSGSVDSRSLPRPTPWLGSWAPPCLGRAG
jgi:hypothetical protein